jgi:hypothetical protein
MESNSGAVRRNSMGDQRSLIHSEGHKLGLVETGSY